MTFASDTCPAASDGAIAATPTAAEPVLATSAPHPSRASRGKQSKSPRRPLYITPRQPDGLLMYARRIPQDILALGLYSPKAKTVRLGLGTRDWLVAQPRATQLTAALDRMWAEARSKHAETSPPVAAVNPRQLRRDDIPVLRQRLESLLLHCDDVDRGTRLTDEQLDCYPTIVLQTQSCQLRAVLSLTDGRVAEWLTSVTSVGSVTVAVDIPETGQLMVMDGACDRQEPSTISAIAQNSARLGPAEDFADRRQVMRFLAEPRAHAPCLPGFDVTEVHLVMVETEPAVRGSKTDVPPPRQRTVN